MTDEEVRLGYLIGDPLGAPGPLSGVGPLPYVALESVLVDALSRPPCVVSFSGGRDSSALLAAALDVARRHGLPPPVPFSLRYPYAAESEEGAWQDLVIDHLRAVGWERFEVPAGDADLLGPVGTASLAARGLLWPPALHLHTGWLGRVGGATVVTGEGGDEVFGPRRATPLRVAVRRLRHEPARLGPSLLARTFEEMAPAVARRRLVARRLGSTSYLSWLRPPYRAAALQDVARSEAREPWSWRQAIRAHPYARRVALGEANRTLVAASYGVRFVHPFLDREFVDAVARDGGPLGYAGRADAMRKIFGHLLPEKLLSRTTKATFNTALFGPATRRFARAWRGDGLDPAVVDGDQLRALWLDEGFPAGTIALLQKAWLDRTAGEL